MSRLIRQKDFSYFIKDLLDSPVVLSMDDYIQHADVSCLEHCLFVSYLSFVICRFLQIDEQAAARGGLLHDLFLYDWHNKDSHDGKHGFSHAGKALNNANQYFELSSREQDIIKKHMWPLTWRLPRYRESFVVSLVDKFCTLVEVLRLFRLVERKMQIKLNCMSI